MKRREAKSKGEKEIYKHLNAEFQRIARRDKKAFLSDQCKECSNYGTIALISHASKVLLKILQARLQQYMNQELPDVQAGFRKERGTRDQIANIRRITEIAREFQKNIYFCFIDYPKAFDFIDCPKALLWITINCG